MLGFWLITVAMLITIPNVLMGVNANVVTLSLLGAVIISSTWLSLYLLRISCTDGNSLLMYLLLLIWIADSGAYFAGRAFGKHKLAPAISPGKSIEGVLGGLIACFIFSYFALEYIGYSSSVVFLAISLTVAFVSVYGDLFESLMKRKAGVKDSGSILPGHGGVLDRLDSLIAAGPFFVACLYLFVHQL
jgi:phosphatidate cytidylyltransferase